MADDDPDVMAAVQRRVVVLQDQPVGEHVAAYEEVDRMLQAELARLEEG